MRWPFRREATGRHALGAAVTAIPSAPVRVASPVEIPSLPPGLPVDVSSSGDRPADVLPSNDRPADVPPSSDRPADATPSALPPVTPGRAASSGSPASVLGGLVPQQALPADLRPGVLDVEAGASASTVPAQPAGPGTDLSAPTGAPPSRSASRPAQPPASAPLLPPLPDLLDSAPPVEPPMAAPVAPAALAAPVAPVAPVVGAPLPSLPVAPVQVAPAPVPTAPVPLAPVPTVPVAAVPLAPVLTVAVPFAPEAGPAPTQPATTHDVVATPSAAVVPASVVPAAPPSAPVEPMSAAQELLAALAALRPGGLEDTQEPLVRQEQVPLAPAPAPARQGPRVELGFADGTYRMLDPASETARALSDLVAELTGPTARADGETGQFSPPLLPPTQPR